MKITLLAIGRTHDPLLKAAIDDYSTRLNRLIKVEWLLLPAATGDKVSQKRAEGAALLAAIPPHAFVIVLDKTGKMLSTEGLARKFEQLGNASHKDVYLVIGGAYGTDGAVMERADFIWSLSELVFPHQLVRLILTEQLYRAYTLLDGHPYHHA